MSENKSGGFVFPTYFFGIPSIVKEFIEKINLKNYKKNYVFAACTCGGNSGNLLDIFKRKIAQRGIELNAAFEVKMSDNYILMFNLLPAADKIAELLKTAEEQMKQIIEEISNKKTIAPKTSISTQLTTAFCYPIYKYGRSTKPFHASNDCIDCGLCEKICPCGMIHMQDGKPNWDKGKCTQCLACVHRCPKRAIQYGNKTLQRGRYTNPHLKGKENLANMS